MFGRASLELSERESTHETAKSNPTNSDKYSLLILASVYRRNTTRVRREARRRRLQLLYSHKAFHTRTKRLRLTDIKKNGSPECGSGIGKTFGQSLSEFDINIQLERFCLFPILLGEHWRFTTSVFSSGRQQSLADLYKLARFRESIYIFIPH
ncbi:hypothetical protein J6590_101348 [Homalodisca vitripennis]|nr:hypothetical protein J6590_101348 [Homalodisca vitripennis]